MQKDPLEELTCFMFVHITLKVVTAKTMFDMKMKPQTFSLYWNPNRLNNPFMLPAPNKYLNIIFGLMDCLVLGFLQRTRSFVLVQGIRYMSKVRQRHLSPWLFSNWMLQGQQCRRTAMRGERCWARVEVSWTGCFVLHRCSIALIRQGTSQVQIQLWHRAKHTWRGRMTNKRSVQMWLFGLV